MSFYSQFKAFSTTFYCFSPSVNEPPINFARRPRACIQKAYCRRGGSMRWRWAFKYPIWALVGEIEEWFIVYRTLSKSSLSGTGYSKNSIAFVIWIRTRRKKKKKNPRNDVSQYRRIIKFCYWSLVTQPSENPGDISIIYSESRVLVCPQSIKVPSK